MQEVARRPLTRLERAAAYGMLGWAAEVAFTAIQGVIDGSSRDWRLRGHSYLWMLPIYGLLAYLYEPLHDRMRNRPAWQRGAAYAAGFLACELASGSAIRRAVGLIPWDYSGRSRFAAAGGAVRLDYAPLWAAAGLLLEPLDDGLRMLPARRVTPGRG
jgi:hypothetical protein